ncbi:MAG: hypothetical protein RR620_08745 [Clostridium sp.]
MKKRKLTLNELLITGHVRILAEDLMEEYSFNIDEILNVGYHQCCVCGFYFHRNDGVSEIEIGSDYYEETCNDCITLLKDGIRYEDIPHTDETLNWYLRDDEDEDCWEDDRNELLQEYIKSVI